MGMLSSMISIKKGDVVKFRYDNIFYTGTVYSIYKTGLVEVEYKIQNKNKNWRLLLDIDDGNIALFEDFPEDHSTVEVCLRIQLSYL